MKAVEMVLNIKPLIGPDELRHGASQCKVFLNEKITCLYSKSFGLQLSSPFRNDQCQCSLGEFINNSGEMLGLWTEKVSVGVQCSGYDR